MTILSEDDFVLVPSLEEFTDERYAQKWVEWRLKRGDITLSELTYGIKERISSRITEDKYEDFGIHNLLKVLAAKNCSESAEV